MRSALGKRKVFLSFSLLNLAAHTNIFSSMQTSLSLSLSMSVSILQAARTLLTLDLKDPKRLFETPPLIRRLKRYGLMTDEENSLDDILKLTTQRLMERRLQTKVFKQGLAKSIHHARVLIRQRHIRVGKQLVNVPSFLVRTDSEKHIDLALNSPYGQGRPGRVARRRAAQKAAAAGGGEEEDA